MTGIEANGARPSAMSLSLVGCSSLMTSYRKSPLKVRQ